MEKEFRVNYVQEVQEELKKHLKVGKGLTDYYTLLVLILGEETTLADVHDAWSVNINRTWDTVANGQHRSLIPFDQLTKEIQDKDQAYLDAIHNTKRELTKRGMVW